MSHVTVFWTQEILVGYVLEELCYRQLFVEWATAATYLPSFADGLNFPWTDIPIFAQGATGKKQKTDFVYQSTFDLDLKQRWNWLTKTSCYENSVYALYNQLQKSALLPAFITESTCHLL